MGILLGIKYKILLRIHLNESSRFGYLMIRCSIVIPVWNKVNFTKACLNDLNHLPEDHEIIIVNNGSTDGTADFLAEFFDKRPGTHIVNLPENCGFAVGCNEGAKIASGESVLFLNNDIKVYRDHSSWTQPLLAHLDAHDDYLVGPTGGLVDSKFNFKYETTDPNQKINYMSGWCLAAKRDTWEKLDLGDGEIFSQDFGYGYFEDTDLSFRATELGIEFKLIPVPVHHIGNTTAKQLGVAFLYKKAKRVFLKKWKRK
jgi:GT2 family glycosyltransferase